MNPSENRDVTLWLPPWAPLREHFMDSARLQRVARQADRLQVALGDAARLARAFDILPRGLPVAALTRQRDAGDALGFTWLRADPGCVRPAMASARLVACGDLGLSSAECEALLKPLKPLFGDEGFPISAPVPSRWYLCLPPDTRLPDFAPPSAVLNDDLFAHLPEGASGQRWRRLMNEAQIILHNHPVNAARTRAGKLPANTLWFWGAGRLPDHVHSAHTVVFSDDAVVASLCAFAGITCRTGTLPSVGATGVPQAGDEGALERLEWAELRGVVLDLRGLPDPALLEARWLDRLIDAVARRAIDALVLDFGDGLLLRWRGAHRWRLWRRRLSA